MSQYAQLPDTELVELTLSGEKSAYEELFTRYRERVQRLAMRMGCHPEDARGVTQAVFLQAFQYLGRFRGEAKFSTWLYAIAVNRARNWLRKVKVRSLALDEPGEKAGGVSPEDRVIQREDAAGVRRALSSLPMPYRTVLVLFYYENLSYAEIAEIVGLKARTVETRIFRARRMLKKAFLVNRRAEGDMPPLPGLEEDD